MNTRSARRGFTLIEVLTVIALLTIILGIGAIAYHDVMSLSSAQGRYRQRLASAEYFLRRFAQDVRNAKAIEAPGLFTEEPTLLLGMPDRTRVAYFMEGHTLQRLSTGGYPEQKMPLLSDPGMAVQFDIELVRWQARAVVATVEWEENPRIGVSHPILSLRVALRGRP